MLLYTTGGESGGTRRAETAAEVLTVAGAFGRGSPSREVRDDFFSRESRLACPVHVPLVPTAGVAPAASTFARWRSDLTELRGQIASVIGLAPIRPDLKGRLRELLCIHGLLA